MLCTIGDLVEDVVVSLRADPVRGSDTRARIVRRRGGSAANVAALVALAGGASRFVGQVGHDATGNALVSALRAGGVDVQAAMRGTTGVVVTLVDAEGKQTTLRDRGASTQLASVSPAVLDGVQVLHVPAYSLTVEPLADVTYTLIGEAVDRGIAVSIDASSVSELREYGIGEFLTLLEQLRPRVFFCNRAESNALGLGLRSPAPGAGHTIVTAAARPTLAIAPDGEVTSVPVPPVPDIVDTTGAGDAFAAGYLIAMAAGQDLRTAVEAGHLLASRVLRTRGVSIAAGDGRAL